MLGWATRPNLRAAQAPRACRVKCSPKGPKLGFEYLPTYKTLHCARSACALRVHCVHGIPLWHQRGPPVWWSAQNSQYSSCLKAGPKPTYTTSVTSKPTHRPARSISVHTRACTGAHSTLCMHIHVYAMPPRTNANTHCSCHPATHTRLLPYGEAKCVNSSKQMKKYLKSTCVPPPLPTLPVLFAHQTDFQSEILDPEPSATPKHWAPSDGNESRGTPPPYVDDIGSHGGEIL